MATLVLYLAEACVLDSKFRLQKPRVDAGSCLVYAARIEKLDKMTV